MIGLGVGGGVDARLEEKTEASIVPPPDGGSNSCVSLTIWGGGGVGEGHDSSQLCGLLICLFCLFSFK